jgi:hypothetical protein
VDKNDNLVVLHAVTTLALTGSPDISDERKNVLLTATSADAGVVERRHCPSQPEDLRVSCPSKQIDLQ